MFGKQETNHWIILFRQKPVKYTYLLRNLKQYSFLFQKLNWSINELLSCPNWKVNKNFSFGNYYCPSHFSKLRKITFLNPKLKLKNKNLFLRKSTITKKRVFDKNDKKTKNWKTKLILTFFWDLLQNRKNLKIINCDFNYLNKY